MMMMMAITLIVVPTIRRGQQHSVIEAKGPIVLVVTIHQTNGPFVLIAVVAIAPTVYTGSSNKDSKLKGAATKFANPPFRCRGKGPNRAGSNHPPDKGPILADGRCCNSTNAHPSGSIYTGSSFGDSKLKGAATQFANPPFHQ
jgi:hypothetical protein